jgi:hypothetical protein
MLKEWHSKIWLACQVLLPQLHEPQVQQRLHCLEPVLLAPS